MLCNSCMRQKGDETVCPFCGYQDTPDPSTHHLPAGTVICNRYQIGRVLGEGGFGITYIGYDHVLDLRVAVKEYFPYGISHRNTTVDNTVSISTGGSEAFYEKGKQRFLNEAKNLARFNDEPGIVDVRDFIEENNTAYIVMKFLDGIDLREYLHRHGTLSVDETLNLLMPVIKSLEQIHRADIIHRDISPDNLMVLKNGSVKLMDFGAARDYSDDKRSMSVMLKKGYAPEEQYRSNGRQGPWTDVYGICATIYRCITGKTPDESLDRLFDDKLKRPSELGAAISPAVENVLMYGLAVRQTDRCQNMTELAALLDQARRGIDAVPKKGAPTGVPGRPQDMTVLADGNTYAAAGPKAQAPRQAQPVPAPRQAQPVPAPRQAQPVPAPDQAQPVPVRRQEPAAPAPAAGAPGKKGRSKMVVFLIAGITLLVAALIVVFAVIKPFGSGGANRSYGCDLQDNGKLLTSSEETKLKSTLSSISTEKKCNLLFVTAENLNRAGFTFDGTVDDYAQKYYENIFGDGTDGIVVCYVLSDENDSETLSIFTYGTCTERITDTENQEIREYAFESHNPRANGYYEFFSTIANRIRLALG